MKTLLIDAKYMKNIKLDNKIISGLKEYKKIALYTSIQFIHLMSDIKKQIEKNSSIKVITSKPSRTSSDYQVLGCDCYWENYNLKENVDAFFYIGDGSFHPTAIALAQKNNNNFIPIIVYNPKIKKLSEIKIRNIEKILRKYRGSLMKFKNSKSVGVFVTTKAGQQQYKLSLELKQKFSDKKFYYFIGDNFDFSKTEDYSFIDMWINTACPRISLDDQVEYGNITVLNLNDAFDVDEILSKNSILTRI